MNREHTRGGKKGKWQEMIKRKGRRREGEKEGRGKESKK